MIAKGNHLSFADISDKGFCAIYDEGASDAQCYEKESIVHVSADETKFQTLDIDNDYRVIALQ